MYLICLLSYSGIWEAELSKITADDTEQASNEKRVGHKPGPVYAAIYLAQMLPPESCGSLAE